MPIEGVVYVLMRGAGECDVVFRPLKAGEFRPRRRFHSPRAAFRFLSREVGVPAPSASSALRPDLQIPILVNLPEHRIEALWPDWQFRPRPVAARPAILSWQAVAA